MGRTGTLCKGRLLVQPNKPLYLVRDADYLGERVAMVKQDGGGYELARTAIIRGADYESADGGARCDSAHIDLYAPVAVGTGSYALVATGAAAEIIMSLVDAAEAANDLKKRNTDLVSEKNQLSYKLTKLVAEKDKLSALLSANHICLKCGKPAWRQNYPEKHPLAGTLLTQHLLCQPCAEKEAADCDGRWE